MKTIFILKHTESADGRGTTQIKFATEDRATIAAFVSKRHPAAPNTDALLTSNSYSHMYSSYYVEEAPLVDMQDIEQAPNAHAEVKELQQSIKDMQARVAQLQKLAL